MPPSTPRISVVIAVKDGEAYIEKCLDSVFAQDFQDFECIVIDDCSTDGTRSILETYAIQHPGMHIVNGPGINLAAALNTGITYARGDYIARLDADDTMRPERLRCQCSYLDRHPDVVALSGLARGTSSGRIYGIPGTHHIKALFYFHGTCLIHPATSFRRDAFLRAGGYRVFCTEAEDCDLWLRMSRHGSLAVLTEVVTDYREHAGQATLRNCFSQSYMVSLLVWRFYHGTIMSRNTHRPFDDEISDPSFWFYLNQRCLRRFVGKAKELSRLDLLERNLYMLRATIPDDKISQRIACLLAVRALMHFLKARGRAVNCLIFLRSCGRITHLPVAFLFWLRHRSAGMFAHFGE